MLGGTRLTTVFNALSPEGSPARMDVANGQLELRLDRHQYGRLELGYGFRTDGTAGGLGINLQAGGADRIRITIAHLDLGLVNLNVVIHTPAGWSSIGQNVGPGQIDFRFADFTGLAGQDFTNVTLIMLVFQVSGSLVLDGIETDVRGSLLGNATAGVWLTQFGKFKVAGSNALEATCGSPVDGRFHTEAHHDGVLGGDFVYSARITADWNVEGVSADLQFRISDEGRYGVRLQAGRISLYRFMLPDRVCDPHRPDSPGPCPSWPPKDGDRPVDLPVEFELAWRRFDRTLQTIGVTVVADGSRFVVAFDAGPLELGRFEATDANLGVGRFGIYVLAPEKDFRPFGIRFSDLSATTDPTALSNFTLLYSVPGYDANGTKRALVRTLNDMDAQEYDEARSSFMIRTVAGDVAIADRPFERAGPFGPAVHLPRTLGFQFLAADFSDLRDSGTYTIEARVATTRGVRELRSAPFEIRPALISETLLRPMSILNAEMRNAADDDFRRNWRIEFGAASWSVGVDGAFVADRADDGAGAVLRRVLNMSNHPLEVPDFGLVAQVTIVAGCDAQLQFRIAPEDRWGVTLQAGAAGGCPWRRTARDTPAQRGPGGGQPASLRHHRIAPASGTIQVRARL